MNTLVSAGAGSGKTTLLVNEYLSFVREHPEVELGQILAITFTEKAAEELVVRIRNRVLDEFEGSERARVLGGLEDAAISTIHGMCLRLMRLYPDYFGLSDSPVIMDGILEIYWISEAISRSISALELGADSDLVAVRVHWSYDGLSRILKLCFSKRRVVLAWLDRYESAGSMDSFISRELPEDLRELNALSFELLCQLGRIVRLCFDTYSGLKSTLGLFDYDDLIERVHETLQTQNSFRYAAQQYFRFVMVDEFQDTDLLQWEIVQMLCHDDWPKGSGYSLFLVGDLFQSIYSFRGANPALFETVLRRFESGEGTLKFQQANYRSQEAVVSYVNDLSCGLFGAGFRPMIAKRESDSAGGVSTYFLDDSHGGGLASEGEYAATWILDFRRRFPQFTLRDFAILCRRKRDLDVMESALTPHGISVIKHGGGQLISDVWIQDIRNLLLAVIDLDDEIALVGVLGRFFEIGDSVLFLLKSHFPDLGFGEIVLGGVRLEQLSFLPQIDIFRLQDARRILLDWRGNVLLGSLAGFLQSVLDELRLWDVISADGDVHVKAVNQFIGILDSLGPEIDVIRFLNRHLSDVPLSFVGEPSSEDAVSLMSIHAAKGLEFPVVILPGLGRGFHFSSSDPLVVSDTAGLGLSFGGRLQNEMRQSAIQALKSSGSEEEKRLFYVACTRARDHLLLMGTRPSRRVLSILSLIEDD